jgi:D-tyrosyl-tRNA(Tyr) deacylase
VHYLLFVRGLIQRVERAGVTVRGETVGRIGPGLLVFVGVTQSDDEAASRKMAEKLWHLRVFEDDDGKMNRSVADGSGDLLLISQFTLYGDTRKGRRPSWLAAAAPERAEPLIDAVVGHLRKLGAHVETGIFQARMQIELVNDGPVTLLIETGSAAS